MYIIITNKRDKDGKTVAWTTKNKLDIEFAEFKGYEVLPLNALDISCIGEFICEAELNQELERA